MKINNFSRIMNNPYQKQMKQFETTQTNKSMKKDQIEISSQALEMHKGEDIRREKVDALKNQINSGNYQVNYEKVAEKFLDYWKNN